MKKKILSLFAILVFISLCIHFNVFQAVVTGFGLQTQLSVGVNSLVEGEIYLNYPYVVRQYSAMNVTARLKNTGSVEFSQRLRIYILDTNATRIIESFFDGFSTLRVGETRIFTVSYTPNSSGFHWIYSNSSFGRSITDAWGVFYVTPYTTAPEVPGYPSAVPPAEYEEVGAAMLSLEYDKEINVSPGQKYLIYLSVKNTGAGNVSLKNVMVFAKLMGIPFDITPKQINRISVDRSGIFLITLNVPYRIDAGRYDMEFMVKSNTMKENGRIVINVGELEIKGLVERIISNYQYIAQKINQQINDLFADGKNVTKASEYLRIAKEGIISAQQLYELEEYEEAKNELDNVRQYLELAILELAMATIPPVTFVLPGYISIILIVIIIAVVIFVVSFWYFRRKLKEKRKS